jgi:hypothetical protein
MEEKQRTTQDKGDGEGAWGMKKSKGITMQYEIALKIIVYHTTFQIGI